MAKGGASVSDRIEKDNKKFYFDKQENIKGSVATEHYHASFELYYMKEGKCNYFIDDCLYTVSAGDVILIPEGIIHRTNYPNAPHTRMLVNFEKDFISHEILSAALTLGYFYSNKSVKQRIEAIFSNIECEYERNDEVSPHALKTYIEELFLVMIRNRAENGEARESGSAVEGAVKYIKENYMSEVKLSSLAEKLSLSPEHLSRIFKKDTGFGFSEYLTLYRLQRAEKMLFNEPGRSVGEIAYLCGFNDSNYFSFRFKERYSIPPTKARMGVPAPCEILG
jgi:AraC-like DNA-binding protein/quercetin dioxygenase-like cupin family protein